MPHRRALADLRVLSLASRAAPARFSGSDGSNVTAEILAEATKYTVGVDSVREVLEVHVREP